MSIQLPLSSHLGQNVQRFKTLVEARSEGGIAIEIFDNSRLYRDDQVLEAVASGAIESGILTARQFHQRVPAIDVLHVPFMFNSEPLVRAATDPDSDIRRVLDLAIAEDAGVNVLWWQAYGSSIFFSKGRDVPLPDAIKDSKIRVPGESDVPFMTACGGKPLVISASKQHEAMRDGMVDMVTTGITGVTARELWKVSDTITRTEHAPIEFIVIINRKVWASFDERQRAIMADTAREVERELRDQFEAVERDAYAFARSKGMRIVDLTSDQVAEWRLCSVDMLEEYMQRAGPLGRILMTAYGRLRASADAASPTGAVKK